MPTAIGSMPHTDLEPALALVSAYLQDVPAWPQLPRRTPSEGMVAQVIKGLPGIQQRGEAYEVTSEEALLEALQAPGHWKMSSDVASGFWAFLNQFQGPSRAVKGQIVGPVTLGLSLRDPKGSSVLYRPELAEALADYIGRVAAHQEALLQGVCPATLMVLDEPGLGSLAPQDQKWGVRLTQRAATHLRGMVGVHCCSLPPWCALLSGGFQVLSFDALNYGESLLPHGEALKGFLRGGHYLAWGLVPTREEALGRESAQTLLTRWEGLVGSLVAAGVPMTHLIGGALFTPACGLAGLSQAGAEGALKLTAELARRFQCRYHTPRWRSGIGMESQASQKQLS